MPHPLPVVAVTATTELIRGLPRVRLNQRYTDALQRAGLIPVVVPPLAPDAAHALLRRVDGLVLTGGEDVDPALFGAAPHPRADPPHPERDRSEIALTVAAHAQRLPTLAICRGLQLVNVAFGGSLIQDIPAQRPHALPHARDEDRGARVHGVTIDDGTRLAGALGATRLTVNSLHHQALDRIGRGLRVAARADDGIIEAAEWAGDEWWMVGVQWHPEELDQTPEAWDRTLFGAFARAVTASNASAFRPAPVA
ncbi:MAG TPA: gamma-glutamyl-gamma-aminobutyrate hydrolase family protein [Gemmatimonadaceae bacterium]|nr:gamma-glutamyl-gamma-aminobutyrate hydrolase family protein [Gemmatimonadaceae bacterium]